MAKSLLDISISDIAPSSIMEDPQMLAMMASLDPELKSVSQDIRETLIYSRIDELSEPVLDLLAWQWHVDFYELARTLEMKRAAVKGSIAWHRKKGTVWAIRKALEMLGIKGTVTEWWKIPGAKPYTFAVEAEITSGFWSQYPDSVDATKVIRKAIEMSKSTRSWLMALHTVITADIVHPLYIGTATLRAGHQALYPETPEIAPHQITHGVGTCLSGTGRLSPSRPSWDPVRLSVGTVTLTTGQITIGPTKGG